MRGTAFVTGLVTCSLAATAWLAVPGADAAPEVRASTSPSPCPVLSAIPAGSTSGSASATATATATVTTSGSASATTTPTPTPTVTPAVLVPARYTAYTGIGVGQVSFKVSNPVRCQRYTLQRGVRATPTSPYTYTNVVLVVYLSGPLVLSINGLTSTAAVAGRIVTTACDGLTKLAGPTLAARPDLRPWSHMSVSISPSGTVGVGTIVVVKFGVPITNRVLAQRGLKITTSRPVRNTSWTWINSRTAMFRPWGLWPAHTTVKLTMSLAYVPVATTSTRRIDAGNRSRTFTISRSFVMYVSATTHRMIVKQDGVQVANFPVSLGMPQYQTMSGIKVISGEKYLVKRMTSIGLGIPIDAPGGYDVQAPYAIRLTPSGEFIHGAPWAYYRIGRWNGSHGCTNMFVWQAKWIYYRVIPGDVDSTTGTTIRVPWDEGPGGPWNIPWTVWTSHSALH